MAQHDENRPIDSAVELLKTNGFAGLADAVTVLLNSAMVGERSEHLGAAPYERSAQRTGYANGYKDKVLIPMALPVVATIFLSSFILRAPLEKIDNGLRIGNTHVTTINPAADTIAALVPGHILAVHQNGRRAPQDFSSSTVCSAMISTFSYLSKPHSANAFSSSVRACRSSGQPAKLRNWTFGLGIGFGSRFGKILSPDRFADDPYGKCTPQADVTDQSPSPRTAKIDESRAMQQRSECGEQEPGPGKSTVDSPAAHCVANANPTHYQEGKRPDHSPRRYRQVIGA